MTASPDPQSDSTDAEVIRTTIERARAKCSVLPQYQELVELEQLLRRHLELLLPDAQASTDRLNRGTVLWYQRQRTLDRIRRVYAEGMGDGLRSAALHVQELARSCQFLLNWLHSDET